MKLRVVEIEKKEIKRDVFFSPSKKKEEQKKREEKNFKSSTIETKLIEGEKKEKQITVVYNREKSADIRIF